MMEYHGDKITQPTVTQLALIGGAVPGMIGEMLLGGITFCHFNGSGKQIAPDFYIGQLIPAFGQCTVQQNRFSQTGGIIHPIPVFHNLDSLLRRTQLVTIFSSIMHGFTSIYSRYGIILSDRVLRSADHTR